MNRKQRRISAAQDKQSPDIHASFQQAITLHMAGQLTQAQTLYDAILKIQPRHSGALHSSALLAAQAMDFRKALEWIDKAVQANPDSAELYSNRGAILKELKAWDEALISCNRAIALQPGFAEAYCNRGVILQELKQWDAALSNYDQAISLKPDYAVAHSNRGVVLQELRQWDAAIASCNRAIALKPDDAESYCNRGKTFKEMENMGEALINYEHAIALKPNYAEAHLNKSVVLLLAGNFQQGWREFQWRWKTASLHMQNFSQPLWLGKESLAGKTILLHHEQGLGDAIQFCRYARLVAGLGAKVLLLIPKPLAELFRGLSGVAELIVEGEAIGAFDYHCPLLSLPLAFQTHLDSIPAQEKYLSVPAAKMEEWQTRLGAKGKTRIGLVWRGSANHKNDHNRSIALSNVIPYLPDGFQYVSLQKEVSDNDRDVLQAHPEILHFGDALKDFTDTGAFCELVDVVISVDTSVAHLSAALGRPTWIMLPLIPDWRWMLVRQDSPWYPTARLYRQEKAGQWDSALERVKADLLRLSVAE